MNTTLSDAELAAIMGKLTNLRELAARPGTAGEAAAAGAAIQRLLFKYNLTMSDVREKQDENAFVNDTFFVGASMKGALHSWKGSLLSVIAKTNFCGAIALGEPGQVGLVGREANVAVVKGIYGYLSTEADRLCENAYTLDKRQNGTIPGRSTHFKKSFYLGFVNAVATRLRAQFEESKQEHGAAGSALVVQTARETDRAMAKYYPNRTTGRARSSTVSRDAFGAGTAAGQSVNLNRQVSGASGRLALR